MKKALIIHGWESNSNSNWFPWLKGELEVKGYEVFVPILPNAHAPILEEWLEVMSGIAKYFGEGDIIVGHSMGGKALMHLVEENSISGIKGILVGPSYETIEDEVDLDDPIEVKEKLRAFHESKVDFNTINTLGNNYSVLLSDNDKFIRVSSAKKYYSQLKNVKFREFSGYGHFLSKKLKEILGYIV